METALAVVFLVVFSVPVTAQTTVYYCNVGGKQQITDVPCDKLGGTETRRLQGGGEGKNPKMDPYFLDMLCNQLYRRKKQILDDQYYRGKPATPAALNPIDDRMREYGCPSY